MSGRHDTHVFWDLDVRPIPDELLRKPSLIIEKIRSTLEKEGYMREVTIWAYSENMECDHRMQHAYLNAGISIFDKVNEGKKTVVCKMLADILYFGLNNDPPTNLMVIAKMNVHMAGILAAMKERKYHVHLVEPDDLADSESEPYDVNTVWTFSSLFEGGKPKAYF